MLLREATHQHGIDAANSKDYFLNDLFSIDGNPGIIRAINKCNEIRDVKMRERYLQAVIVWNGNKANEMQARKIITDYSYFTAVLTSKRIDLIFRAVPKLMARNLAQFLQPFKYIRVPMMDIRKPVRPIVRRIVLPATELMLENIIGAHAPTAAETLTLHAD